ncbi:VWA domain-containing protein, partial [Nocardiopsis tropica]
DGPAPGTPAPGVPSAPLPPGAGGTAGPSVPTGAVPPADGSGRPGTACAEAPPEALDAAGQPSPGPVPGGGAPHAIGAADRWRLVLGRPPRGGGTLARRASAALDELYGRGHGEGSQETSNRPGARGGDGSPEPAARRWDEELQDLFGGTVREEVLGRAAARGRADALDRLDPGRVTASVDLLEQVLSLAGALPEARLAKLRPLIAAITEQLVRQLARRMSPALSGLSVPRPTRRRGGPLDLGRTVRANLRTVRPGPDGPLLIPEAPVFRTRARRSADWHVHIVVDVSGSMERSTVYAALVAAVLHGLPALSVSFTTFSTEVVDLTDRVPDPLSLLLEVSVGGGTDIGAGLAHTRAKVRVPSRTIVALVTDFEEGGNLSRTLAEVRALAASGAHLLGLAALDDTGAPVCNQALAAQFVAAGMPVASLSPQELASWIGEKVRG